MEIIFLGLGHMGLGLALQMQEKGHTIRAWNRSEEKRKEAKKEGLKYVYDSINEAFDASTSVPKVIWLMVSAGPAVDDVLFGENGISKLLSKGDIVIDGANSYYKDSVQRSERLFTNGVLMLDCGVSGGVEGARSGACVMVGGHTKAYEHVEQLLKDVSVENGVEYFGHAGSGHFVKMVHNAIEYGMMQSLAEGINMLEVSEYRPDLLKTVRTWAHGSIIESRLVGFLLTALEKDPGLRSFPPAVGSLGTGKWATDVAKDLRVPFRSIDNAVDTREQGESKESNEDMIFKVLQAMRTVFGGHTEKDRPSV
jgi:6-phosphogluconate dehydrogenase